MCTADIVALSLQACQLVILPDVIFADPQVLLDKVTELVLAFFQISKVTAKK